ncbi:MULTISPECIES: hypothetical protein [unclassified Pseudomonas]|uniref:hypothetical protein n=1 Tax=unclassified Pseudomonas TaxID=196821 RepID=UPI0030DB550B
MPKSIRWGILSALIISGCSTTSLTSYRDGQGPIAVLGDDDIAHGGVVYHLPMLQFNITVTRTLANCTRESEVPGGLPVSDIKFDYKVKTEPTYVAGERFVLDYEENSNWSKTGEVGIDTYDNGVLKTLNSVISDDTAAIVANLVSTGVGVAKIAMGVPSIPGAAQSPMNASEGMACSPDTMKLLDNLEIAARTVKEREGELAEISSKYDHLDRLLKLEIISQPQMVVMADLLSKQEKAEKRLKSAQGVAEAVISSLSTTDQMVWPRGSIKPNTAGRAADQLNISSANSQKLMGLFVPAEENPKIAGPWRNELDLISSFRIWVALQSVTEPTVAGCKDEASCKSSAEQRLRNRAGLFYRSPVPAQLMVCQTQNKQDCLAEAAKGKLLGQPVMAPQMGALRFLPLTNGNFQNNSLSASFRSDGTIAAVTYKELASRGKALTGAIASSVDSAGKFYDEIQVYKDKKRKEKEVEKDALRQDELDALQHQIAVRKKEDELDKLGAQDPTEGNTASSVLNLSYAALAEAELKRLNAEQALAEARKNPLPGQ